MALSVQEKIYVDNLMLEFRNLAVSFRNLDDLRDIYFDRGYSSISDADLQANPATADLIATDLTSAINFIEALSLLLNNGVPSQADWDATISKLRSL